MKRCYVSGKIGGLTPVNAALNFAAAELIVHELGMKPVSPFNNKMPKDAPYWMHMAADLLMLATCRNIFMQRNWRDSRGARIEHEFARHLKMTIWYQ